MAEAIKTEFGVNSELIEGGGGVLDVHVNGTQVWSKHETGRFPEHAELVSKITELAEQS